MGIIQIQAEKCNLCGECVAVCPFGAMEIVSGRMEINAACRMCGLCIRKCPQKAISKADEQKPRINKEEWRGIMVFAEYREGMIHPVALELIGKARELALKVNHPVYAVFIGLDIGNAAQKLLLYGVDRVFVYDHPAFRHFRADIYADAFEDCIQSVKPCAVLIGATSIGRSLAPRVSTRFRTGLTADCTGLDIRDNTDLIQTRPAFGGNIMARILTKNNRPQFATVRYKVMNMAEPVTNPAGTVEYRSMEHQRLVSRIRILESKKKQKTPEITDAEIIVAAGRGLRNKGDMALIEEFADLLGGQVAVTRGLVEDGWAHYTKQIGLSGRTVKPRLIITCGVSGAVQFTAGMNGSENIFAINTDINALIFKIAHYGIVGDLYEVVPALIEKIKKEGSRFVLSTSHSE